MMEPQEPSDLLSTLDVVTDGDRVQMSAVAVLNRSEVEAQLDAAHRYPRSIKRFLSEAVGLATLTQDVAESCIYTLPRAGKAITGPSVRLAEIAASAYGNLHVAARVVGAEDKEIVSQGVAWDLEKNLRATLESRRRITYKSGARYDDDMVTMTGNAAASIALRNAIFRVIPRAYIDAIYAKVREVAVGTAQTLSARRERVMSGLGKMGLTPDRILARVEKVAVEDVGLQELEVLIGLGTAVKNGDAKIDEAFPSVSVPASDTKDLEAKLRAESNGKVAAEPKSGQHRKASKQEPAAPPPPATAAPSAPSTGLPCVVCKLPVMGAGVSSIGDDGRVGIRHQACQPVVKKPAAKAEYVPPNKRGDQYEGPDSPEEEP